jgi:DNA-binding GntR family transcriptional regulator
VIRGQICVEEYDNTGAKEDCPSFPAHRRINWRFAMQWIAPSEKDGANDAPEKRLWEAADQLRRTPDKKNSAAASCLLGEAVTAKRIRASDPDAANKLMRYVPYWA